MHRQAKPVKMDRINGTVDSDLLRLAFDKYQKSHSMGDIAKKQKKRNLTSLVLEEALGEYVNKSD